MNQNKKPVLHRGSYVLFFAQFVERFGFWGLSSILVVVLLHQYNLPHSVAYVSLAAFMALSYVFSVLGGLLADRVLGFKRGFWFGWSLILIGSVFAATTVHHLYLALAVLIVGNGFYLPTNAALLSILHQGEERERDRVFTLFYMGTNLGGILGPVVFGLSMSYLSWHAGFWVNIVLLLAVALVFALSSYRLKDIKEYMPVNRKPVGLQVIDVSIVPLIVAVAIFVTWSILNTPSWAVYFISAVGALSLLYVVRVALRRHQQDLMRIVSLVIMIACVMLFFTFEYQVNSSLQVFAQRYVNYHIAGFIVPISFLPSIEPLAIILFAPLVYWLWRMWDSRSDVPVLPWVKLMLGFFLTTLAFFLFYSLTWNAFDPSRNIYFSLGWFVTANVLLGLGELMIVPIVISSIANLAPESMKGLLIGILFMSLGFSGYFSGQIAALTAPNSLPFLNINVSNLAAFRATYFNLSCMALAITVVLLVVSRIIRRRRMLSIYE